MLFVVIPLPCSTAKQVLPGLSTWLSVVLADNAATMYTSRGRELANQIATLTSTGAILNKTGVTGDRKAMQEALWGMAAEVDNSITCTSNTCPPPCAPGARARALSLLCLSGLTNHQCVCRIVMCARDATRHLCRVPRPTLSGL